MVLHDEMFLTSPKFPRKFLATDSMLWYDTTTFSRREAFSFSPMYIKSTAKNQIAELKPLLRRMTRNSSENLTILTRQFQGSEADETYKAFVENHCAKKEGGPAAYYEILVLYPDPGSQVEAREIRGIFDEYLRLTGAEEGLTFGVADHSVDRLKIEMVISGNELHGSGRLKRPERFYQLVMDYLKMHYPEFANTRNVGEKKPRENFDDTPSPPGRFKRKRIYNTRAVARKLDTLIRQSASMGEVLNRIVASDELQLYDYQGELRRILYLGQKFRFHTLGLCKSKTGELLKVWESRRQLDTRPAHRIKLSERLPNEPILKKEEERPLQPYKLS